MIELPCYYYFAKMLLKSTYRKNANYVHRKEVINNKKKMKGRHSMT